MDMSDSTTSLSPSALCAFLEGGSSLSRSGRRFFGGFLFGDSAVLGEVSRETPSMSFPSTLVLPSRIGRRHNKSSLASTSGSDGELSSSDVAFLEMPPDLPSSELNSALSLAGSSTVRMEEVTSHHIVVRSLRTKQIVHVGATGLRRPDK
jgi:hypothetical protein